jgi:hypothetical protein
MGIGTSRTPGGAPRASSAELRGGAAGRDGGGVAGGGVGSGLSLVDARLSREPPREGALPMESHTRSSRSNPAAPITVKRRRRREAIGPIYEP